MILEHLVEFFEDLELVRGRSKNTIMAYRRDLDLFADFYSKNTDLTSFYAFMKKQGLSVRSQARVISSVRTYFKFCQQKSYKVPLLRELRPPKVNLSLPKTLSIHEFEKLFEACKQSDPLRTARNQMTLLLLYGLGCRVSELIALNLHSYHEIDNYLIILGKGQKERLVPLTEHLGIELKKYIQNIRPHLLKEETNSILINDRGHRPSRVDIWRWLAAWSQQSGFSETVSPHRFRHACATSLLESGADLRSIQVLLGHSSIQTTQIYTSVTSQNLTDTIDKYHPLSNK